MTPPAKTLWGAKQQNFRGSTQLRLRGSHESDFSNCKVSDFQRLDQFYLVINC